MNPSFLNVPGEKAVIFSLMLLTMHLCLRLFPRSLKKREMEIEERAAGLGRSGWEPGAVHALSGRHRNIHLWGYSTTQVR
ncbi:hypothetical protein CSUI_004176 [Cystoisospora suis]|uniref:Uncharacterized protein n=1 Tax=Cystoisospora suis TaxID=483139 RepID=A0A2C6KY76_9APIC|nr:hypothetical protein CSUI_004176 [Cystoisospora suis]